MSMKVKNSQLNQDAIEALNNLIELDINASVAFKLTRVIKELSSIVDDKTKMEKRIFDKWIEKDENGDPVPAKDKDGNVIDGLVNLTDAEQFSKEMESLMNTENEIPFDKINFDDLQMKTAKVKDLMKLDFLFN
jgi:hypothetical protein